MIVRRNVMIILSISIEVDTDKVEYGVHGGVEDSEEIADMAERHVEENINYDVNLWDIEKGIRITNVVKL